MQIESDPVLDVPGRFLSASPVSLCVFLGEFNFFAYFC
jgi:hypothetical protein